MRKKSEKHSFVRNLSVDSSADASSDAPAIINIRKSNNWNDLVVSLNHCNLILVNLNRFSLKNIACKIMYSVSSGKSSEFILLGYYLMDTLLWLNPPSKSKRPCPDVKSLSP